MKGLKLGLQILSLLILGFSQMSLAMDPPADKAKEAAQDAKKTMKKSYRNMQDKTCEMVHGKMECKAKEAGHKIQNATDEVKDKMNDTK